MPISWLSALKIIPWGDVIEAAPGIARAARRIFVPSQQVPAGGSPPAVAGDALLQAQERIVQLEAQVGELAGQLQASAGVVEALAEQHAKVVQAIQVLRLRTLLLGGFSALLAAALAALGWWTLR